MLSEFRNHLTIFLAGTTELSATLPHSLAAQFADRLDDMEASAEFLQTLLVWMDTSISGGALVMAEIGDVFRRTENLASSGLPHRARLFFEPRPGGVRNRGAALECALAALLTELGRLPPVRTPDAYGPPGRVDIRVYTTPQRGSLSIHIESNVEKPRSPGGWRVALARVLLGQVGATLEAPANTADTADSHAGFIVRFRFK
ncbi:MAG TPA: hypothetical protein VIU64_18720 [Polyangia bacterium]